jgi:hypothetical protein
LETTATPTPPAASGRSSKTTAAARTVPAEPLPSLTTPAAAATLPAGSRRSNKTRRATSTPPSGPMPVHFLSIRTTLRLSAQELSSIKAIRSAWETLLSR